MLQAQTGAQLFFHFDLQYKLHSFTDDLVRCSNSCIVNYNLILQKASGKKRKISDEGSVFQKKSTKFYFFPEISDKPVCLVCSKHVAAKKKSNLERHYDYCRG